MIKNYFIRNSNDIKFEPKISNLRGVTRDKFWTLKNKIIFGLAIILFCGIIISLGLIPIYSGKEHNISSLKMKLWWICRMT